MYEVENHGSICIVQPLDSATHEWLQENTEGIWWGGGLAVEPRYLASLEDGLMEAGFASTSLLKSIETDA